VRLPHVWVVSDLADSDSCLRISIQDLRNEVLAFRGEELRHLIVGCHDFLVQVRSLWVFKGQISGDHRIEDNARTPDISLKAMVPLAGNHL